MSYATIQCPCGAEHTVDFSAVPTDPRGRVHKLNRPALGVTASTLQRWAKSGRLRAFRGPRRVMLAWELDIRAAVEAEPLKPVLGEAVSEDSPAWLLALANDTSLEAS